MPRAARILASVLTTILLFSLLGVAYWRRGQALEQVQAERDATRAELQRAQVLLATNWTQLTSLTSRVAQAQQQITHLEEEKARLAREKEAITRSQQSLESEMRRALESKDVTISELQGKLTVDILDRVLFDSGEATLKPEGEQVLRRVAQVLAQYPNRQVHVIGHTDNVPIRADARGKYPSNWELSTARATAAVRFLSEQAGVDPRRLGAVGYGEFHPVADNSTPEGRAKNRRIALVVLSEEMVGVDTAPAIRPAAPAESDTNAPAITVTNATLALPTNTLPAAVTNTAPEDPTQAPLPQP